MIIMSLATSPKSDTLLAFFIFIFIASTQASLSELMICSGA